MEDWNVLLRQANNLVYYFDLLIEKYGLSKGYVTEFLAKTESVMPGKLIESAIKDYYETEFPIIEFLADVTFEVENIVSADEIVIKKRTELVNLIKKTYDEFKDGVFPLAHGERVSLREAVDNLVLNFNHMAEDRTIVNAAEIASYRTRSNDALRLMGDSAAAYILASLECLV